jgi:hypothetical protein
MNGLLAELSNKRKQLESSSDVRPNKYVRKGDLQRLEEQARAAAQKDTERPVKGGNQLLANEDDNNPSVSRTGIKVSWMFATTLR